MEEDAIIESTLIDAKLGLMDEDEKIYNEATRGIQEKRKTDCCKCRKRKRRHQPDRALRPRVQHQRPGLPESTQQ